MAEGSVNMSVRNGAGGFSGDGIFEKSNKYLSELGRWYVLLRYKLRVALLELRAKILFMSCPLLANTCCGFAWLIEGTRLQPSCDLIAEQFCASDGVLPAC